MIRPLLPSDAEDSEIFAHYKSLKTAQTLVSVRDGCGGLECGGPETRRRTFPFPPAFHPEVFK